MVSAAARRSILVRGGGARPVPKDLRRVGAKRIFSNIPEKISFYHKNFLMTFFYSSKIATTKLRSNNGIGRAPTIYRRRRRRRAEQQKSAAPTK